MYACVAGWLVACMHGHLDVCVYVLTYGCVLMHVCMDMRFLYVHLRVCMSNFAKSYT